MTKTKWWLLGIGILLLCFAAFAWASIEMTKVKYGSDDVSTPWWVSAWGLFGTGTAFSLPALWALLKPLLARFLPKFFAGSTVVPDTPTGTPDLLSALMAVGVALAGLLKNRTDKAALRAFMFALVDAAEFIPHIDTSHEGGKIILTYDAFADVPAAVSPVVGLKV